jgi:hypothetical protein
MTTTISTQDATERRLLDLAVHPEHFTSARPADDPEGTPAGLALVESHRAWSRRTQTGIRVDYQRVESQLAFIAEVVTEGISEAGVDLSLDGDDTRSWLRRQGIFADSLSHRDWLKVQVPQGSEGAWSLFRRVRTASSDHGKLVEIAGATVAGRVFPRISTFGTITGRMTVAAPALQNLSPGLRGLLLPDPGQVLISADLRAAEPTIAAAMSGDSGLREAVASGDVYAALAKRIWPALEIDSERRRMAKAALLAQLYGQGVKSLSERLHLGRDDTQVIVDALHNRYRRLFAWLAGCERDPRPETPWGRRLPLPGLDRAYAARNWAVQGAAADLFRLCVARIAAVDPDVLWLPVHDELVISVSPERAPAAEKALRRAFAPIVGGVQFAAEVRVHPHRWGK